MNAINQTTTSRHGSSHNAPFIMSVRHIKRRNRPCTSSELRPFWRWLNQEANCWLILAMMMIHLHAKFELRSFVDSRDTMGPKSSKSKKMMGELNFCSVNRIMYIGRRWWRAKWHSGSAAPRSSGLLSQCRRTNTVVVYSGFGLSPSNYVRHADVPLE